MDRFYYRIYIQYKITDAEPGKLVQVGIDCH